MALALASVSPSLNICSSSASVFIQRQFRFCKSHSHSCLKAHSNQTRIKAIKEKTQESNPSSSAEEITKKYGLEAGLWKVLLNFNISRKTNFAASEQIFSSKEQNKGDKAKVLLTTYGGAYLATSIGLSLISFSLCFALISAGVDVQALLHKVGISSNETGEKVGTFALAYAAHKDASPIRFPPTVTLTPIVAKWIGKKVEK